MEKPKKESQEYYDYNECRDYLEAKYDYDERDYAGRFTPTSNPNAGTNDIPVILGHSRRKPAQWLSPNPAVLCGTLKTQDLAAENGRRSVPRLSRWHFP
jgi:hypothetical protein